MVFQYIRKKGILVGNVVYAVSNHRLGRIDGGMDIASICVLKEVRIIQKKGASVITQQKTSVK